MAVEQVGHAAPGEAEPAPAQGGVDLRHAAVFAAAQRPHKGGHIEAEPVSRQGESALRLRPVGDVVARTALALAAADAQARPHRARQGRQGVARVRRFP